MKDNTNKLETKSMNLKYINQNEQIIFGWIPVAEPMKEEFVGNDVSEIGGLLSRDIVGWEVLGLSGSASIAWIIVRGGFVANSLSEPTCAPAIKYKKSLINKIIHEVKIANN